MGAQRARRQRGPRRGRVPQGAQRGRSTRASRASISAAEESTAWPGVSRPDLPRRPRLRLQVEHGLDARHARLLPAGPGPPPLPPPRADVLPRLRVHARTSSCRSPTTRSCTARARCSSKMPGDRWQKLANLRALYALHVGPPRQEAAVHGRRAGPGARSGATSARSTGTCSRTPSHAGVQSLVRDLNHALPRRAGAVGARLRPGRASRGSRPTTPTHNVVAFAAPLARTPSAWSSASPTCRRCRATATGSGCRAPGRWREVLNTDVELLRRLGRRQPRRRRGRARRAGTTSRSRPSSRCRRSASSGSCPEDCGATPDVRRCRASAASAPIRRRTAASEFRVWAPRPERRRGAACDGARAPAGATRGSASARRVVAGRATATTTLRARRRARCPTRASRWQPEGLRGPSRRASTRARSPGPTRGWAPRRRSRDLVLYELHVGTFTRRGHVRRRPSRTCAALRRARRHRDRADAGRRVPGPPRLGLRRRLPRAPPSRPTAARRGSPRLVDAAHAAGLGVILDVVYNHVGASGATALDALRPVLHRQVRDAAGATAINYDDARLGRRARVGAPERRALGRATSTSTACGSTPSTRSSTTAPSTSSPASPTACTRAARRARDRRARPQRPAGDPRRRARRLGLRRRTGPTTSTTRCACCSPATARATTPSSARSPTWPRPSTARTCTTARTRRSATAASARRPTTVPPEQFVVFGQNHDQVGNRALGDRLPRRGAAARGVLHAALAVHADAVHGRGVRRERAVPVLHRPHRRGDRRRPPARAAAREFAAFAAFAGEEVPDPQDPATFERSKLTRTGEPAGLRDLYRRAAARPPRPAAGRRRRVELDEHAGWLRVRRGPYELVANFSTPRLARARSTARRGGRGHAPRHAASPAT